MFKFLTQNKKNAATENKKGFLQKIGSILSGKNNQIDEEICSQIEKALIEADFGYKISNFLVSKIKKIKEADTNMAVNKIFTEYVHDLLDSAVEPITTKFTSIPHVIMVCGINGNGKTTTVGKIAYKYKKLGMKVLIAACDTFRASAIEQLEVWANRASCDFFSGNSGADPASVAYGALKKAYDEKYDVLLIDTAGRLHTQKNLMEELAKIHRVLGKIENSSPHDVFLVLDATTGQNAMTQIDYFYDLIKITGIVLTKFDGTAKAGVIIGIADKYKDIKIKAIGTGEKIDDLFDFDVDLFCSKIGL